MIFFFLLLDGFQLIPLEILTTGFFSGASADGGLLIFIFLFLVRGRIWLKSPLLTIITPKILTLFSIFIIINCIYAFAIQGYSPVDIFKGGRYLLYLFSFLLFVEVSSKKILQLVRILVICTLILSIIFLVQIVTGKSILQGAPELVLEDINYTRFYNLPKLLDFSLAVVLFWFPFRLSKGIRYLLSGILILTVIGPLHRGYLFSWFVTIFLFSLVYNSLQKKLLYIFGLIIVGMIALSFTVVGSRLNEAIDQISVLNNSNFNLNNTESNTFIYRVSHVLERVDYINSIPGGWFWGIGLIDERAPQVDQLPLKIGLPDPVSGKTIKVYTADISWSTPILTIGFIGTILFIIFWGQMLRIVIKNKINLKISKAIFTIIIVGFLSSFTSSTILEPRFIVPIMMLIVYMSRANFIKKGNLVNQHHIDLQKTALINSF